MQQRAAIQMIHIPYPGTAPAQAAILGKQVAMVFDSMNGIAHVKSGTLRPLAISANRRIDALPDVPTMAEAGFTNFEVLFWMGLLAPAGTPEPIITRLFEAARLITTNPKAEAVLKSNGDPVMLDPKSFASLISQEVPAWGEVIRREALVLD
jgi:tripartite-type tricarboxylate transporter receptor subunit TctC